MKYASFFILSSILISLMACGGGSDSEGGDDPSLENNNASAETQALVAIEDNCANGLNTSAGSQWCWIKPAPQGNRLNDAVYANGQWTLVGANNTIINSRDLVHWEVLNLYDPTRDVSFYGPTGSYIDAIAHSGDRYLATSSRGMLSSEDAVSWDIILDTPSGYDIHYANGLWVTTDNSAVFTSTDGIEWNEQILRGDFGPIASVTYGDGTWVIVGSDGFVSTSTDGLNWIDRSVSTSVHFEDVVYSEDLGLWVIVGYKLGSTHSIYTSSDTIDWQAADSTTEGIFHSIEYNNNLFVAVGEYGIFGSGDGITWQVIVDYSPSSANYDYLTRFLSVEYSYQNSEWLVVGSGGDVLKSADGRVWIEVASSGGSINAVHFDEINGYVAVGDNGFISGSDDGINWNQALSNSTDWISAVYHNNGTWIAVGSSKNILRSTDRQTWTATTLPTTERLNGVSHDPTSGRWVAVGWFGIILSSDDGINWTERTSGVVTDLYSIHFAANLWVAVGYEETILTSADGISWTKQTFTQSESSEKDNFYDVTYADGQWLAVSSYLGARSVDGVNWQPLTNFPNALPQSITYGNGEWRVTGLFGGVFRSTDLITWEEVNNGSNLGNTDIIFSNNKWIISSREGGMSYESVQ